MPHSSGLLRRCSLLKISPLSKPQEHMPRDLILSYLPRYIQNNVKLWCFVLQVLYCIVEGKCIPSILSNAQLSLNLTFFFKCNSRVTQLTWVNVHWNHASWKPAWVCPLAPVSAPNYLCTLAHPCRCFSEYTCLHAGWCMNAHSSHPLFTYACKHTHILKCTHPFPFSGIHLRAYTDLFESSCFQKGFIYRSCLVVNVKGRKPLRGFLSCVNQPRLRALGSQRGGFHS